MKKKFIIVVLGYFLCFFYFFPVISVANSYSVRYQTHLQDMGWISTVYDGKTSGTTGQARRMEAISIALAGVDGKLSYQVHCETYGWLNRVSEGTISGTTGQGKRMEAIVIFLENSSYILKYRVHVQELGWMNWVNSGEMAGTTGQSKRIEAIQIKLEKKNLTVSNNEENDKKIGIDVSKYQGNIDWKKVKESGIDFAMIRCGYRGYTVGNINQDEKFINNINGAYSNGIKVGLYFYSSAINEKEAIEEAEYVLNLVKNYQFYNYITYPIAIDIEDFEGARNFSLSIQERTDIVKVFCDTIQSAGFRPMVYSYTYFLSNKLYMNQLRKYDTWIADYYGNTWYNNDYKMWQYTDKGKVNGIDTEVDMNYSYY